MNYVMTPEVLFEDAMMEFSTGLGEFILAFITL